MKRILQAVDGVATKPVVGADSMAKFLRVVKEADLNQPTAPVAPTAPAQPQVDPAKYQVPSVDFFKKNYKHPADIIDGAHPSTSDPTRIGAWQGGSDFADLMMALSGSYYQARQADPNFKQPAFVKDDWELIQRMLGTPEGKEYAIDQSIGLSNIDDKSSDAEFNRVQHKEFEKQANARAALGPTNTVVTPGWKYDQKLGMTPAQAELQKQKAQQQPAAPAPVSEGLSKFLSIVKKNDVKILNESRGPHKVALPVQMTMQHYQKTETAPAKKSLGISKYLHKVEEELAEQQAHKRQLINQYASIIAERVMMKESANPDPAQFAKPPQVPQVPAKDGMYGSWEFTTRKDGDRSATHPQYGTFIWDNSGAGGALRPITWSLPSNSIPGMSWVTDFVSGTHTLEATGKLAGGDLEYQGKMQTKLDGTPISGSVGLKGYGHDANFTSANGKATGTYKDPDGKETSWDVPPESAGEVKQEGLDQLLALRNKIDEAIKQRLDPKCWTGKHKEGTKVKGGVRVNNCVPNESVNEHEAGWERHGQGPGMQNYVVDEAPLDFDKDSPMSSRVYGHKGANSGSIEYRMARARGQLQELAKMAERDDPLAWQHIARLFPELAMNIEQIDHGLRQLGSIRRKGGRNSKNIPQHLDPDVNKNGQE